MRTIAPPFGAADVVRRPSLSPSPDGLFFEDELNRLLLLEDELPALRAP